MTESRLLLAAPALALSLTAAGCGSGSPRIARVASSATTASATTQSRSGAGGAIAGGGSAGARRAGGDTFISVGDAAAGAKFSVCMRRHGLPGFPDPDSQGGIEFSFTALGIARSSPKFRSAMHACRTLLPHGLAPPTPTQLAQVEEKLLAFSSCMRAHGITDFPDPSGGSLPRIQPSGDLDPNSPHFRSAYTACKSRLPTGVPDKALGGLPPPSSGGGSG
jgi:hypothetical protein